MRKCCRSGPLKSFIVPKNIETGADIQSIQADVICRVPRNIRSAAKVRDIIELHRKAEILHGQLLSGCPHLPVNIF
jgi:hypothetical protein